VRALAPEAGGRERWAARGRVERRRERRS